MTEPQPWSWCIECGERHSPDYDCLTYRPVCADCGHQGDRRFRYSRPGVLRDILAPSLSSDHLECAVCESVSVRMEVVPGA